MSWQAIVPWKWNHEHTSLSFLAAGFFFIFASGYEFWSLLFYAMALGVTLGWTCLTERKALRKRWFLGLLIAAVAYVVNLYCFPESVIRQDTRDWLLGAVIAFTMIGVFENQRRVRLQGVLWFLLLPLIAHAAFFLGTIPHYMTTRFDIDWSTRIEALRLAAKIGPKHLGQVLVIAVVLAYDLMSRGRDLYERKLAAIGFFVACFSLALIDSRAAYLCLAAGILVTVYVRHQMRDYAANTETKAQHECRKQWITKVVLLCVICAFVIGWHRLNHMGAALKEGLLRPQQHTAWITPQHWEKEFCPDTAARCKVDNSIYLRMSWLRFGLTVMRDHPFGIGPSNDPLAKALKLYYPKQTDNLPLYNDFHSGIMDTGVNYGVFGVLGFLMALAAPFVVILRRMRQADAPAYLPLLGCLWVMWITRLTIDGMNPNLWYAAWGYAGIILALIHRKQNVT